MQASPAKLRVGPVIQLQTYSLTYDTITNCNVGQRISLRCPYCPYACGAWLVLGASSRGEAGGDSMAHTRARVCVYLQLMSNGQHIGKQFLFIDTGHWTLCFSQSARLPRGGSQLTMERDILALSTRAARHARAFMQALTHIAIEPRRNAWPKTTRT